MNSGIAIHETSSEASSSKKLDNAENEDLSDNFPFSESSFSEDITFTGSSLSEAFTQNSVVFQKVESQAKVNIDLQNQELANSESNPENLNLRSESKSDSSNLISTGDKDKAIPGIQVNSGIAIIGTGSEASSIKELENVEKEDLSDNFPFSEAITFTGSSLSEAFSQNSVVFQKVESHTQMETDFQVHADNNAVGNLKTDTEILVEQTPSSICKVVIKDIGSDVESHTVKEVYCICKSSESHGFMIECDNCKTRFHGDCINLSSKEADSIEAYYCEECKSSDNTDIKRGISLRKKKLKKYNTSPLDNLSDIESESEDDKKKKKTRKKTKKIKPSNDN